MQNTEPKQLPQKPAGKIVRWVSVLTNIITIALGMLILMYQPFFSIIPIINILIILISSINLMIALNAAKVQGYARKWARVVVFLNVPVVLYGIFLMVIANYTWVWLPIFVYLAGATGAWVAWRQRGNNKREGEKTFLRFLLFSISIILILAETIIHPLLFLDTSRRVYPRPGLYIPSIEWSLSAFFISAVLLWALVFLVRWLQQGVAPNLFINRKLSKGAQVFLGGLILVAVWLTVVDRVGKVAGHFFGNEVAQTFEVRKHLNTEKGFHRYCVTLNEPVVSISSKEHCEVLKEHYDQLPESEISMEFSVKKSFFGSIITGYYWPRNGKDKKPYYPVIFYRLI